MPVAQQTVPEFITKEFGTQDPAAIVAKKAASKETVVRTFAVSKPAKVAMSADECKAYCKMAGIDYLDGYESRVLRYTITDESVDRYGDIIRADGLDIDNYLKNPTVLYMHEHRQLPVAKTIQIEKTDKKWSAQALFMDERCDPTGVADAVFRMASSGFLPACSIGFLPKKVNSPAPAERLAMGLGDWGVEYVESELLEWSPVSVPANPNAIQEGIRSGVVKKRDLQALADQGLFSKDILGQVKDEPAPAPAVEAAPAVDIAALVAKQAEEAARAAVEALMRDPKALVIKIGAQISAKNKDKLRQAQTAWNEIESGIQDLMKKGEALETLFDDLLGDDSQPDESEDPNSKTAPATPVPTGSGERQALYPGFFEKLDAMRKSLAQ